MLTHELIHLPRRGHQGLPALSPELNKRLNRVIERLLKINREKDKVKQSSGQKVEQTKAV
jgi:predicted metallopeptidase